MGLDIRVAATVQDAKDAFLDYFDIEAYPQFVQAVERLRLKDDEQIHTQPGSYFGLHRLRKAYAASQGFPGIASSEEITACPKSHLCSHCDSGGWYLPENFDKPQWIESSEGKYSVSVGSTQKLLAELQTLVPAESHGVQHEWDALYVPAVASIACRTPIRFS